ncbi:hypothetical protein MHBO_000478 [Bonamia ostreae]|uniref:Uncharacterized protein n=1 Tax=Bonamia ostreae TaxID=126728 RepID=A0ABV2AFR5_9EUKA
MTNANKEQWEHKKYISEKKSELFYLESIVNALDTFCNNKICKINQKLETIESEQDYLVARTNSIVVE